MITSEEIARAAERLKAAGFLLQLSFALDFDAEWLKSNPEYTMLEAKY